MSDVYSASGVNGQLSGKIGGVFGFSRRASARFYLSHIVFPVLDDFAASNGLTINDQIAKMIGNKDTVRRHMSDPQVVEKLEFVMAHPGVHFLLGRFEGYLNYSKEQVFEALPWWMERIRETRPDFYKVLVDEPGGREWFGGLLFETISIVKEYLKK